METLKKNLLRLGLMVLFLAAASGLGALFRAMGFPETNTVLAYLLGVIMTAWLTNGYLFGVLASIAATLTFNYLFTAPVYTLSVDDPSYLLTFGIMTVTALMTSTLTSHVKKSALEARAREADTKAVYDLTRHLTEAADLDGAVGIALAAIADFFGCPARFIYLDAAGRAGRALALGADGAPCAQAPLDGAGAFSDYSVRGAGALLGYLRIPTAVATAFTPAQVRLLCLMTDTLALSMDRLTEQARRVRSHEEAVQERYRGNLLRAISHDLRTPLAGIMGASEMLIDMSQEGDPRRALAADIYKAADWLHALVENILNLTRLEEGRLALDEQMEAIEEVVGSAVNHVAKRAEGREISVRAPEALLMVPMDAKLIEQVLVNLLDNAIKHTPPEGEIKVGVSAQNGFARVCVADRGSGIREEDLPNVFKMFYTAKDQRADAVKGVGLGLTICQAIVRAHGGEIEARNREDGVGAEFSFTLPLTGAAPKEAARCKT